MKARTPYRRSRSWALYVDKGVGKYIVQSMYLQSPTEGDYKFEGAYRSKEEAEEQGEIQTPKVFQGVAVFYNRSTGDGYLTAYPTGDYHKTHLPYKCVGEIPCTPQGMLEARKAGRAMLTDLQNS